jgi:hypothetical protein
MIREPDDIVNFTQNIFTVEGAGWGLQTSLSRGLLAQITPFNSVTLAIGQGNIAYHHKVQNISGLGLNIGGQGLLKNYPLLFAQNYGFYYVSEVVYGAAYLGYFNIELKPGQNVTHLDWYKELDVN